jgi:hypothetical protein
LLKPAGVAEYAEAIVMAKSLAGALLLSLHAAIAPAAIAIPTIWNFCTV